MARRLRGRLAQWLFWVGVALTLLSDAPQQRELGTHASEVLASLSAGSGPWTRAARRPGRRSPRARQPWWSPPSPGWP